MYFLFSKESTPVCRQAGKKSANDSPFAMVRVLTNHCILTQAIAFVFSYFLFNKESNKEKRK
jgi:hypothetical protein